MRELRYQGKLTNWNDKKGFGFVEPNGGGSLSFVHISALRKRSRRPKEGDLIVYEQVKEANGKFKAKNVSLATDRQLKITASRKPSKLGYVVITIFVVALISATLLNLLPTEVLVFYFGASCLAIIAYALDKRSAQNGRWRTPESHLHLLGLLGGWPGAFYAQNKLKHKTSKKAFKQIYWVTAMVNVSVLVWFFSKQGQQLIAAIVG